MQSFVSHSEAETADFAREFAKTLKPGDVVAFFGGLGAGKTTFTRYMCEALNCRDDVSSPTFAIVNVYGEHNELCHFDMYRVESWDDLYSTGFFDYIDMGSVLCVEWSENIENALPENTVRVYMEKGGSDNARIIRIDGVKDENSLC